MRHFALHSLEHMLKVRWLPENDNPKPKGTPGPSNGAAGATVGVGADPSQVRIFDEGKDKLVLYGKRCFCLGCGFELSGGCRCLCTLQLGSGQPGAGVFRW